MLWVHFYVLVIASVAMILAVKNFRVNEFFSHPQFANWDYMNDFESAVKGRFGSYRLYFIVDSIWAFILLTYCYHVLKVFRKYAMLKIDYVLKVFAIIIILAYLADFIEGILYLTYSWTSLEIIVPLKKSLYTLGGLYFIYGLWKYWANQQLPGDPEPGHRRKLTLRAIRRFVTTSFLSIGFVVFIAVLGTVLPQGYSMMIDLFNRPINLVGTLVLICVLSLVFSHYPAYLEIKRYMPGKKVHWHMIPKGLPIGIIYYNLDPYQHFDPRVRTYRYHLGTAVFVAFLFMLSFTGVNVHEGFWFTQGFAVVTLIIGIWFQYKIGKVSTRFRFKLFKVLLIISFILFASLMTLTVINKITDLEYGWSLTVLNIAIITTFSLMLLYLSFRWSRRRILRDFEYESGKILRSTRVLITIISVFGIGSVLLLIFFNVCLSWVEGHVNPIPLLLLYILGFYGAIAIVIKLSEVYGESEYRKRKYSAFFRYGLMLIIPGIIILTRSIPEKYRNEMHFLEPIQEDKEQVVSVDKFIDNFNNLNTDSITPIIYTSYGGGLMADLWAMLVSHELQECTNGRFFQHTINMSANSGGAIGFANYVNLSLNHYDKSLAHGDWDKAIEDVGLFNHLTPELTHLWGKDLLWKLFPYQDDSYGDRSAYSMQGYARLTGNGSLAGQDSTYRSYWMKVYNKYNNDTLNFPSMTLSTSSVINSGFANMFTLKTEDHGEIFSGIQSAIDIPGKPNKSLSYYDAVSMTNRFPIISSVASVDGVGHFLDGGYYDNSGLLNGIKLRDFLKREHGLEVQFVSISNDTEAYINHVLSKHQSKFVKINNVGEFGAIIKNGISFDKISDQLEGQLEEEDINRVKIFLPRIISLEAVEKQFGGELENLPEIMKIIEASNGTIRNTLKKADPKKFEKWGVVQTPLGRLLSEPGVHYAQVMLKHHPDVKSQLKAAKDLVGSCIHLRK